MSSRKEFKIKTLSETLKYKNVDVKFKLEDCDVGKNADDVLKVEDDLMISAISKASFHNGLIIGDKIVKVNGVVVKSKTGIADVLKGGEHLITVYRRDFISVIPVDRWTNLKSQQRPGFSYFLVTATRPSNVAPTAPMGMTIKAVKNRAILTTVEPNSIASLFFALGDSIIDFDGTPIPFGDTVFIREEISKFQKNGKMTVVVERPVTQATANELRRYILSIMPADNDFEMAADVKAIGLEASNMHSMIFKKLKPPSILTADVRKRKNTKVTVTENTDEKNIKISTASTEMRITSDVEDEDDLKDVTKKSHAASAASGFFDDE